MRQHFIIKPFLKLFNHLRLFLIHLFILRDEKKGIDLGELIIDPLHFRAEDNLLTKRAVVCLP
jgi:hypothetical protein